MKVEPTQAGGSQISQAPTPSDSIDRQRQQQQSMTASSPNENKVPPEEILDKIKELTGDGFFSVRFEMDKQTNQMVIRVVDNASGKLIRQIPPESVLKLKQSFTDLRGNLVNESG